MSPQYDRGWRNAQLRRLYDKLPVKVARRLDDLGERARRMAESLEAARGRADARRVLRAEGALCARAAYHHCADGAVAISRSVRI